ncbi:MAG TPA: molybdate ABC transporter substrate-binding protein [Anaerolineales bacterium]|nr:molybdate ABC transporter substrate-binding protein [Anaerolineales bacterium]
MKSDRAWPLLLILALAACHGGQVKTQEITVFAAASLTGAFSEIAAVFEAENEGVRVLLNFAGSSQLAAQLTEGVPADVFASANATQIDTLIAAGWIDPGMEIPFAANRLTVIVPADNPAGITAFEDLARPGIALVLAVEGVPVREYTDEIVAGMPPGFRDGFYANLVSEESNVRQVVAKIALGEADAAVVYDSDVTQDLTGQVHRIPIPEERNVTAAYLIAPLAASRHRTQAQAFVDFALSPAGQTILARWGFSPPPE